MYALTTRSKQAGSLEWFHWKLWGQGVPVLKASEPVRKLYDSEKNTGLPVILDRFEDFERYAREAALVTFRPDYYRGPFLEDKKRLRRVTFTAVGVKLQKVIMNFSFTLSYEDFYDHNASWEEQADLIEEKMSTIIESLEGECGLVRGGLSTGPSIGETLAIRP
jgi:hypothetical protein